MLDETLVFDKTVLGQGEIANPGGGLAPKMRRALVLVDGVKSVGELASMFRTGEVDSILEELQDSGHITLEAQAPTPPARKG